MTAPYRPIITRAQAKAQGLKRYYTGKTCRAGHIAERYVATASCVACADKRWRGIRHELGHTILTVRLRVPTGQLPARLTWLTEQLQAYADKYFAPKP